MWSRIRRNKAFSRLEKVAPPLVGIGQELPQARQLGGRGLLRGLDGGPFLFEGGGRGFSLPDFPG
jgi:hypothetical protein